MSSADSDSGSFNHRLEMMIQTLQDLSGLPIAEIFSLLLLLAAQLVQVKLGFARSTNAVVSLLASPSGVPSGR